MVDCKRKTANLLDADTWYGAYKQADGTYQTDRNTWHSLVVKPFTNDDIGKSFCFAADIVPSSGNVRFAAVINGVQINGQYTGNRCVVSFTVQTIDDRILFDYGSGSATITTVSNIMLNKGSTPLPYEPYGWVHSLRKLTTVTDTFTTLPVDIYADGNSATVSISGNTVQNGTGTPDNPIMPNGTGERTGNLFDKTTAVLGERVYVDKVTADASFAHSDFIDISGVDFITVSQRASITTFYFYANKTNRSIGYYQGDTAEVPNNAKYVRINMSVDVVNTNMLVIGSTAPTSYIPYGYKIPISSAGQTNNIYLGEVQSSRQIKKLVLTGTENFSNQYGANLFSLSIQPLGIIGFFNSYCTHYKYNPVQSGLNTNTQNGEYALQVQSTQTSLALKDVTYASPEDFKAYLAAQYAAGTPVTVWYVLATEETAVVNEPLMKIGDYADTVSGITVPTVTGKDTFDVETTLKPSEVELTYTGWHDATVKEKSRNLFDKNATNVNNGYITNGFLQSDGSITTNIDYRASEYIKIVQNQPYILYYGSNLNLPSVCFYDSAKNYISGIAYAGHWDVPFTAPQNTEYLRLSFRAVDPANIMLNEGYNLLPYEPYWQ